MQNAVFSLFVAAGILAAAPSSAAEPSDVALQSAAREYRITVYETFRETRDDYDRWREAGDKLLATWKNSDRTPEQQQQAIDWYIQAVETANRGELPPLPEFPQATRRQTQTFSGATLRSSESAAADEDKVKLQPFAGSEGGKFEFPVLNRRRVQQLGQPDELEGADDSAMDAFSSEFFDSSNPFEDSAPLDAQPKSNGGGGSNLLDNLRRAVLGGEKTAPQKPAEAAPIAPGDGQ